jgi:glutaminase
MKKAIAGGLLILGVIGASIATGHPGIDTGQISHLLGATYDKYKGLQEGSNADAIPALAKVNPKLFGIALVTVDGEVYSAGDVKAEVSIQAISNVLTMARVLQDSGEAAVRDNVGLRAMGEPASSLVAIEQHEPLNPLVNAGAIATTSMVRGDSAADVWKAISGTYDAFAGRHLVVNEELYKTSTNQRNQAIGMLMYAYEHIKANPLQAVDLYTRQCSVSANAVDLAVMAATLANGGKNPVTKKFIIDAQHVPAILSVMATAGLDGDSGRWLAATGLPATSGIGGGLIAVVPGKFGIAVISPPLDKAGTSVRGQRAIMDIASALDANPYYVSPK